MSASAGADAERAYFFRHALLRDAAYQLQLPGDRAWLHALALHAVEELAGGRPPEANPDSFGEGQMTPHPTDRFARELSEHARLGAPRKPAGRHSLEAARRLYLRRAAELSERGHDMAGAGRLWTEHAELVNGVEKGESLRRAGVAVDRCGRPAEAQRLLEEALGLFQEHRARRLEGIALAALASVASETGRAQESERLFERALVAIREAGTRRAEGVALESLAVLYYETGRVDQAERTHEQALALHREVGNRKGEGVALGGLAIVYASTKRAELAEKFLTQSLAIHREVGNRHFEGIVLGNLASLYWMTGRLAEAEAAYERVIAFTRETGNRRFEGIALGNLAGLNLDARKHALAATLFLRALDIHRQVGNRRFEGANQCGYALALLGLGNVAEARETWLQGAATLRQVADERELKQQTGYMQSACAQSGVGRFDAAASE